MSILAKKCKYPSVPKMRVTFPTIKAERKTKQSKFKISLTKCLTKCPTELQANYKP